MRISDWSSDVCSSDLAAPDPLCAEPPRRGAARAAPRRCRIRRRRLAVHDAGRRDRDAAVAADRRRARDIGAVDRAAEPARRVRPHRRARRAGGRGMKRNIRQTLTIARRDFIATVLPHTFLIFLLAPLIMAYHGAIGGMGAATMAEGSADRSRIVPILPRSDEPP